MVSVRPDLA